MIQDEHSNLPASTASLDIAASTFPSLTLSPYGTVGDLSKYGYPPPISPEVTKHPLGPGSVSHIWALGDRVIVLEDAFHSGYGCPRCNPSGTDPGGTTFVSCSECGGTGKNRVIAHARCAPCEGRGRIPCPDCGGKGTKSLVIPQESSRRPSSGRVVSAGSECKYLKVGDSVLYSNFAGYVVDLANGCLRILHETEILAGIEGHLTLADTRYKTELAEHSP